MPKMEFAAVATDKVGSVRIVGTRPVVSSNPKEYPLEVENIGTDVYILMSRGHHDVHAFMRQVRADGYSWPLGMPRHLWFRAVPDRSGEFSCRYVAVKQGDRGAFPVTHTSEAWGKDSYEQQAGAAAETAPAN